MLTVVLFGRMPKSHNDEEVINSGTLKTAMQNSGEHTPTENYSLDPQPRLGGSGHPSQKDCRRTREGNANMTVR
jgi:hypothetical protein